MIGKILKSGSFGSKVDYVTREKHDKKIFTPDTWKILDSRGLMGEKRNQIIASFEAQAMQNRRIGNPAGHITLSFSAEDKPKLSDDKMLKIALTNRTVISCSIWSATTANAWNPGATATRIRKSARL